MESGVAVQWRSQLAAPRRCVTRLDPHYAMLGFDCGPNFDSNSRPACSSQYLKGQQRRSQRLSVYRCGPGRSMSRQTRRLPLPHPTRTTVRQSRRVALASPSANHHLPLHSNTTSLVPLSVASSAFTVRRKISSPARLSTMLSTRHSPRPIRPTAPKHASKSA